MFSFWGGCLLKKGVVDGQMEKWEVLVMRRYVLSQSFPYIYSCKQ